jgi:tetratricopeptide (TPR) repeat protein
MFQEKTEMPPGVMLEKEIEAAEELAGQGQYSTALATAQSLLLRAEGAETRIRLLFNIVSCSAQLELDAITDEAARELERMPDSMATRMFANYLRALAFLNLNRPSEALTLIESNLNSNVMKREDCKEAKYEHLVHKGRCLGRLLHFSEALEVLDAAHVMYPDGKCETEILIARSNILMALHRYDEAFEGASKVLSRDSGEMATLAMQYMAECRMWQSRVEESLKLYDTLQKRLPCRLVDDRRIQEGMRNGIAHLERKQPERKPS